MATGDAKTDPSLRDLAWVGYHPRAAAPAITLAAITSVLVLSGRWYLDGLSELADHVGALVIYALAWAVWPGLAAVFIYRAVMFTYRLTDQALFVDFGYFSRPVQPIALMDVVSVEVCATGMANWLGVGWVEVRSKERSIRMTGLRNPKAFAERIKAAMAALRQKG